MNATPVPPAVKSVVLFDSARVARSRPLPFAIGLARPNREKRAPYTAADLRWAAENLNRSADPSPEQYADYNERRTLSEAEWIKLLDDAAEAEAERNGWTHGNEYAEIGLSAMASEGC